MHLAFQLNDARLNDIALSEAALKLGIVAPALSMHATGARANGWNGFVLGYAQVPAGQIDALVRTLAVLLRPNRGMMGARRSLPLTARN